MYLACFAHGQRQRRSQLSPLAQPLVSLPLIAATIAAIVWPKKKLSGRWPKSQRQQKAENRNNKNNKSSNNVVSRESTVLLLILLLIEFKAAEAALP